MSACGARRGCWPRAVLSAAPPAAPPGSGGSVRITATRSSAGLPRCYTCARKSQAGLRAQAAPASPTSWAYRGVVTPVTVPGWAGSPAAGPGSASRCFTSCFPPPPQSHRSGKEPPQEGQDLQNQTGEVLLPLLFFHCALGSRAGLGCCCAGVQLCGRLGVHDHGRGAVPPP